MSHAESGRYDSHMRLSRVGPQGQARLSTARVVIVGLGGLGSAAASYATLAGVGHITLVDDDRVSLGNLQRQLLYTEDDVGAPKVDAAWRRLHAQNSATDLRRECVRLNDENARALLEGHDIIIDCSDNEACRLAINGEARRLGLPWVFGSAEGVHGQACLFEPSRGPCYACLLGDAMPSQPTAQTTSLGVLASLPGIVGAWQATLVLGHLLGALTDEATMLTAIEPLTGWTRRFALPRNPRCPVCGEGTSRSTRETTRRGG